MNSDTGDETDRKLNVAVAKLKVSAEETMPGFVSTHADL